MRYKQILTILAILFSGLLPASGGVGAQSEPPIEINLHVETPAYTLDATGVRVAGYETNNIPGAPALPFWSTVVELPPEGAWTLSYEAGNQQVLTLTGPLPAVPVPQIALDSPLSPAEIADRVAQATWADRPDPAIYGTDAFYPAQLAQAGPEGW